MLYICGTPIGNMEDMTLRVLRLLEEVDLIAAEDTRQTVKLLNHFGIKTPLTSYYEHNKEAKGPQLIKLLKEGKNIALVTDAGMPCISDPGEDLIRLCIENDIEYTAAPGATAAVTALVLSGISSRSYIFEGFLPKGKKQRQEVLGRLVGERRTVIFYEAPHHLMLALKDIFNTVGDRKIAVIRELTKRHECVVRGLLSEVTAHFEVNEPKGEFVLVLEGADDDEAESVTDKGLSELNVTEHFNHYINKGYDEKTAMKLVAKERGVGKREIYAQIKTKE
jgi:16S rRNA (cytidine1402-2'-O)-methyltransferase